MGRWPSTEGQKMFADNLGAGTRRWAVGTILPLHRAIHPHVRRTVKCSHKDESFRFSCSYWQPLFHPIENAN
jgi:hypothetical protein